MRSGATLGAGRVREEWLRGIIIWFFGGEWECVFREREREKVFGDERRRCDEFVKRVLQWGFLYLGEVFTCPLSYVLKDYDSQQPKGRGKRCGWTVVAFRQPVMHGLDALSATPRARGVM